MGAFELAPRRLFGAKRASSSSARRATPSGNPLISTLSSGKNPNCHNGPSWTAGSSIGTAVCSTGIRRPCTTRSWLPVPRETVPRSHSGSPRGRVRDRRAQRAWPSGTVRHCLELMQSTRGTRVQGRVVPCVSPLQQPSPTSKGTADARADHRRGSGIVRRSRIRRNVTGRCRRSRRGRPAHHVQGLREHSSATLRRNHPGVLQERCE